MRYLGHAAFELALSDGRKVLFDPYEPGSYDGAVGFAPIEGSYDVVVVSHDHPDHRWKKAVEAAGDVVDKAGEYDLGGIRVTSYPTFHDESGGSERGTNLVSIVEADGLKVAHLGDLGHMPELGAMPALKGVDVLLVPVGGFFTIDAETAAEVVRAVGPAIAVPMHFKTAKLGFPIAPVDGFISAVGEAEVRGGSELEIEKAGLPAEGKVVVLEPAM